MDEHTLKGLEAAYRAAPSDELARIIGKVHINNEDYEAALPFIASLADDLEASDRKSLITYLLGCNLTSALAQMIEHSDPDFLRSHHDSLLDSGQTAFARAYKTQILAVYPSITLDADQTNQAQINPHNTADHRPKLKLVEKAEKADIAHIDNYKQDICTFADVVGLENVKKQIDKKIIMPFQRPGLFSRFKKKIGGGVLLYGPPGCGKTLLARATAGECKADFYNIEVSDVLDMYIGESEQKLHAIFEKARAKTPSVIFFDEMEAIAGKRDHARNNTSANIVSQFLTELDGFNQNNSGVLILASTNVPWAIDPAFLRPGRFDRMFFVPPPDKPAREDILRQHMKGRPSNNSIDYSHLAKATGGYSGADLTNLVEMAADEAIDESLATGNEHTEIDSNHFKEALHQARATTSEWLTTARNYARYANDGGRYNDVLEFLKRHGK